MKFDILVEAVSPNKAFWQATQSKFGPSGKSIDPDEYPAIKGLEGPFYIASVGKVLYYDPKEGKYYDRKTDFYVDAEGNLT